MQWKANDRNGNIKDYKTIATEHGFPRNFMLFVPIFIGTEKEQVSINMELEPQGESVVVYLESPYLLSRSEDLKEQEMGKVLTQLKDAGLTCIEI